MKTVVAFIFVFTTLLSNAYAERQLLDRVVAVVNDEPITQSELDILLRPLYEQYKNESSGPELIAKLNEVRQKLLNQLVEDRLVYQEAKARGLEVNQSEIDEMVVEFKKRFPNETAYEEALRAEGLAERDLLERMRRQALIRQLHDIEIRSHVIVSPLEVEEYYRDHPEEFASQDSLRVRSFTLKKNSEARQKGLTDEDSRARIEEFRRKILAGEDFAALAKEFSEDARAPEGGLNDWIERGVMIPEIDDVIFRVSAGGVSEVIETSMGYHFFRVEEKREGKKLSLEEVRDQIFSKLYRDEVDKRFHEWMDALKQNAYISIR